MDREQVLAALSREPFSPLRMHLTDGKKLEITFSHVARVLSDGVIVFKGVKAEGNYVANGYRVVGFERIDRIQPRDNRRASRP